MVAVGQVIGYLPVKIDVVGHDKNLLNVVALYLALLFAVFGIVVAYTDHFSYQCAYDEQNAAVHARNRVINNNDFIFTYIRVCVAAANQMIEVQKSYEVAFTLAEVIGDRAVGAHDFIGIRLSAFLAERKALKTRIEELIVNAFDGRSSTCDVSVEVRDFTL